MTPPDLLLALDQGTTSSRAMLFNRAGECVAMAQQPFEQLYPHPGWVEQRPEDIWSSQWATVEQVLAQAGVEAARIAGIGITNQRETTIVWDRASGQPVHPAIVWQCRRTSEICHQLIDEGLTETVRLRTGLEIDAYFSGTKLKWILDQVDPQRRRAGRGELAFGTVDSWLLWNLTGGRVHATDITNASRTMLLDIHTGEWSDELLARLEIPHSVLPQVLSSDAHFGDTALLGDRSIPIQAILGDQQAALFGQACLAPGMAKCTYGTGCFLLMQTGSTPQASRHRLLTTPSWRIGERTQYALEGSVFMGGATMQWLRDGIGLLNDVSESAAVAREVGDTGGVYLVPAFTGLGAPYWDMEARGIIYGLTRGTDRRHLIRAGLESIAFQTRDVLRAMQADAGHELKALRVDGGAACNNFLMQFQADILNVPVQRPRFTETTALGAALMAGMGLGWWPSPADAAGQWILEREFVPRMSERERCERCAGWDDAVSRTRGAR